MSAATDAIRAELLEARQRRIDIGEGLDAISKEIAVLITRRGEADREQEKNQEQIEALEKSLELLDPNNET